MVRSRLALAPSPLPKFASGTMRCAHDEARPKHAHSTYRRAEEPESSFDAARGAVTSVDTQLPAQASEDADSRLDAQY